MERPFPWFLYCPSPQVTLSCKGFYPISHLPSSVFLIGPYELWLILPVYSMLTVWRHQKLKSPQNSHSFSILTPAPATFDQAAPHL